MEIHRDLPIDVQARHLFATRLVDDVIIANAYASEEELSTLSKIDSGKLTLRLIFEADLHPTEEKDPLRAPAFCSWRYERVYGEKHHAACYLR